MSEMYYFAIGRFIGSAYHMMPHWTHYLLLGTEDEVKKMYAKFFILDNDQFDISYSFRDYVKDLYYDYEENYKGEYITDDMIMEFLDHRHFNIATDDCNEGWKKFKDLTEMELCEELVPSKPLPIEFDEYYTFDCTRGDLVY